MSVLNNGINLLLAADAAAASGYQISRSLRFNSLDTAYLNRVPAFASNRNTWTWSGWVKRCGSGNYQYLWGNANSSAENGFMLRFNDTNTLQIADWTSAAVWQKITTQVFRDESAWYHILISYDTTNTTAADRARVYVNGSRVTAFSTSTDPSLNYNGFTNNTSGVSLGRWGQQTNYYFDGYLADVYFVDGQALTPTDFTTTDSNGELQPIAYTGNYGLVSVAAATGALPVLNTTDTYGAAVGSGVRTDAFASSIALDLPMGTGAGLNLTDQSPTGRSSSVKTVTNNGVSSSTSFSKFYGGSAYFNKTDVDYLTVGSASDWVAFNNGSDFTFETWFYPISTGGGGGTHHCLFETNGGASSLQVGLVIGVDSNGAVRYFLGKGSAPTLNLTTDNGLVPVGAWTHIAVVQQSKIINVYINGTVRYTYDASSYSFPSSNPAYPLYIGKLVDSYWVTDGYLQDYRLYTSAKYTSNFSPVVSYNNSFYLQFADNSSNTASTLGKDTSISRSGLEPSSGFAAITYTGNGGTQSITTLFAPDFVWLKGRSVAYSHQLYDTVRGAGKVLGTNNTSAESTVATNLTSFTSTGFTLGSDAGTNESSATYVAWCWKAGGTAVSNTAGSITSTVSANPTYGFSVVTYTGTGATATVGTGLNSPAKMIIVKNRSSVTNWRVYHNEIGNTKALFLSTTGAPDTNSVYWNNTSPTSTVFTAGSDDGINGSGNAMVAYCWSEIPGFSKFGSYTGNGSSSGPMLQCGFTPRYFLVKRTDTTGDWWILDTARSNTGNPVDEWLAANRSDSEFPNDGDFDFLPDGIQIKTTSTAVNASGGTYIFVAFADSPGNNWTPVNFSVTAGASNDSLVDSPTSYGTPDTGIGNQVRGNYCCINPNDINNGASIVLKDGNLEYVVSSSSQHGCRRSTFALPSGKWYAECTIKVATSGTDRIGIISASQSNFVTSSNPYVGAFSQGYAYMSDGQKENNATQSSYGASYTTNDVIGIALDMDAGTVTFYKNNSSQGQAFSGLSGAFCFAGSPYNGGTHVWNFGQRSFVYTAPSGFKAVVDTNLSTPTIAKGNTAMDAFIYTGNGGTQTFTGLNLSPDFIWMKRRDSATSHALYDIVRGVKKYLNTDGASTEYEPASGGVTAFNSDGFTIVEQGGVAINQSSASMVGWVWDAGTSTVSNTQGTVTSQVRANATAGFSVVTYTAGSNTSQTVGHGLGVAPQLIIVKERNFSTGWFVYHASVGNGSYLSLNSTSATTASNLWNSTSPTSTVFTIRSGGSAPTSDGGNVVAYCFTPVVGNSSFGSYTGNGSSNGPFVFCNFRPRWVMVKCTQDIAGDVEQWVIKDTTRSTYNEAFDNLYANLSAAEDDAAGSAIDILSNGFKLRGTYGGINGSATYIYIAFAESPFSYSRAR